MTATYHIPKCGLMEPVEEDELDLDPRGLIKMFEPPHPKATYVMGIDPTVGITGWDRNLRTQDDYKTDNAAIEIIRVGNAHTPDVQVCEYAAPIDPEDLADVANMLGRLYTGRADDNQCLCIIEVYPGPGLLTQRRMINEYHYYSHFIWKYLDTLTSKPTNSFGWTSTPKSVRDLWIRCSRHIKMHNIRLNSPWLVEEMCDCEMDMIKMAGKAAYGKHDDRVRAIMMAIWASHDWSQALDLSDQHGVEKGDKMPNWQSSDITLDAMMDAWENKFADLQEDS